MTTRPSIVTDTQLAAALRQRADAGLGATTLVRDVVDAIAGVPQRRAWQTGLAFRGRSVALVAAACLVTASVGWAALGSGAGPIATPATTPGAGEPGAGEPGTGEIAFVQSTYRWDGGFDPFGAATPIVSDRQIMRIAPGGGDPTVVAELTELGLELVLGGDSAGPMVQWSPDGTRLAFRLLVGKPGIYLVGRDGSGLTRLLERAEPGWDAAWGSASGAFEWSPDGTRLAFAWPIAGRIPFGSSPESSLYVVDTLDGKLVEVAAPNADGGILGSISWSPDGTRIAFSRSRGSLRDAVHGLFVIRTDGVGERKLATIDHADLFGFGWSPDGTRIAFSRSDGVAEITGTGYTLDGTGGSGVWIVNVDGSGTRKINTGAWIAPTEVIDIHGGSVAWSPNGRLIATFGPNEAITLIATDGSLQRDLPGTTRDFDWSPDGTQLVFFEGGKVVPGDPATWDPPSIYVIDVDGTDRRWLVDGEYPDWSR